MGTGYWGRNLVRNFDALGALAAICDSEDAALTEIGESYPDAARFEHFEDLLAVDDIDAVAIATPAATHGTLARRALESGRHVFVEKPLCLDLDEAHMLGELSAAQKRTLMVGHLLLYHPAFRALQSFVDGGGIGTLRYIYSNRASLGKIRNEENALWSFAPHDISMIVQLIGSRPTEVSAAGGCWLKPDIADTTLTHMTFDGNVQAHIFVSWLHPFKDHRLVAVGSDGMVVFNDVEPGADKLLYYPHVIGWEGEVPTVNKADASPIPWPEEEPLACECAHFLECVSTGRQPRSDASEGRTVLSVLNACQEALVTGKRVRLGEC